MELRNAIRDIPDFPKPGILFKDVTTLWKDPVAFKQSADELYAMFKNKGIQKVVGAESRGFIVGAPLAYLLGAGFVPVRKKGKLPGKTISMAYALEYGEAEIEIHEDAISRGDKVLVADDLLATGGTCAAICELIEKLGGEIVACAFVVELKSLGGRQKLKYPAVSLIEYDGE